MNQRFKYKYLFTPTGTLSKELQVTKGDSITEGIDRFIEERKRFMLTLMECKQISGGKFEVSFDNKYSESMDVFIVDEIPL